MGKFAIPRRRNFPRELNIAFLDRDSLTTGSTASNVDFVTILTKGWNSMLNADVLNGNDADHIVGWAEAARPYEKYHIGAVSLAFLVRRKIVHGEQDVINVTGDHSTPGSITEIHTKELAEMQSGFYLYVYFPRSVGSTTAPPWAIDTSGIPDKDKVILEMKQNPQTKWVYVPPIWDRDGARTKDIQRKIKCHMTLDKQLMDRRGETIGADTAFEGTILPATHATPTLAAAPDNKCNWICGIVGERNDDEIPAVDLFVEQIQYCSLFKATIGGVEAE